MCCDRKARPVMEAPLEGYFPQVSFTLAETSI